MDEKQIRKDRLRFTKNKMSANLVYLAILFNVFYFVSIYKLDVGNYYYNWVIGVSVIYNLLFMLVGFLSSEGVKNYRMDFSIVLLFIGAAQFFRITIIPKKAVSTMIKISSEEQPAMEKSYFTKVCIYLIISGALAISAGIIGIIKSRTLSSYMKEREAQKHI